MIPFALLLFFCPWGDDLWALPKLTVVCAALSYNAFRGPPSRRPADWRPWVLAAAALGISTLFSYDLGNSLYGVPNPMGLGLLQWLVCALLCCAGLSAPAGAEERIVVCGLIMAGYAALQAGGIEFPFLTPRVFTGIRHASTQGSPVFLGFMLVVVTPVVFSQRDDARRLVGLALLMGAACAAKSRAAIVAIPVVIGYLYWSENADY